MSHSLSTMTPVAKVPLYLAVRNDLQRRIRTGEVAQGEWLPSEAELQRSYGVSQTSVRRALLELERAGLIRRHQGRGSMVVSREITAANRMIGLGTELRERGHDVVPRVLEHTADAVPDPVVATALRLADGEPALHVHRLFEVDGVPTVLFEHWLPPVVAVLPEELDRLDSLYLYLTRQDLSPVWAHEAITATLLTAEQARVLETDPGAPALIRTRIAYTQNDQPIEHTTYWIRADRYAMQLSLRDSFG